MRADTPQKFRNLYPPIAANRHFMLDVGHGHKLYVEESGNPRGIPIIFLHGGPGGGINPIQRRFFNPKFYRIIAFDQRGCGKSIPHAAIHHNTTQHLIDDMEAIRRYLGIQEWILFGGSWGSTLALCYAIHHPDRVLHMMLRGIFLMTQAELKWFYGDGSFHSGTGALFPEAYERFINFLPPEERSTPIHSYYRRLTDDSNRSAQLRAAQEWSLWESATVCLVPDIDQLHLSQDPQFALPFARIEAHYFTHCGFLDHDTYILDNADKIAKIPTHIIQGRYDAICPPKSAFLLHQRLSNSHLYMAPKSGHSAFEPEILHALINATDQVAETYYKANFSPNRTL